MFPYPKTARLSLWLGRQDSIYRLCDSFPRVIPLFGSSNAAHFTANLAGLQLQLSDEELTLLNNAQ